MKKQLKRFEFEGASDGTLSSALEQAAAWVKEHYRIVDGDLLGTPDVLVQLDQAQGWSVIIYATVIEEHD